MGTVDPIDLIKLRFVEALADGMPVALNDSETPVTVPVFYAYPGDDIFPLEGVFLDSARSEFSIQHLRANVRRRSIRAEFEAVVQVIYEGPSEDADDNPGLPPQYLADRRCRELWAHIEARIADSGDLARLGSPELVDAAQIVRTVLQFGPHDNGPYSRLIATISVEYSIV
jgi:hypothetical protein